ncbi:murein biosynthesis integral membrane protein MurJ [Candidatus Desantisbacteria bacterium]|nr:murein biosynthesis integral membrane protein MurJ [Candidatus Desantisbacteria bacterium]
MKKDINHETTIASFKVVSLFTSLSRILGYFRSLALAAKFGTGIIADAFFVAFRIPNSLRKLFGEGAINNTFIPLFSDVLVNEGEDKAFKFANKLLTCLAIITFSLTILVYLSAPWLVKVLAPGFAMSPGKFNTAVFLLKYLFPYLFFISLTALCMGILNSFKQFAVSAFSPVLFNLSFIFSILILSRIIYMPEAAIIAGVLGGGVLQLLIHIIALKKINFKFSFDPDFKNPMIKKIGRLILPSIFALAITEINIFINNIIASYESIAGKGAISALFYANFLVQLPLSLFAGSIATVFFPDMAHFAANKDFASLRQSFTNAIRISFFIILPASIGLITLSHPITKLLYQHGNFTAFSTQQTSSALIAYSIGLFAFAGIKIIIPVFYSLQDVKTPVKIGGIAVFCNLILCIIFSSFIKHTGLALAASVSAFLNFFLLLYYLEKRLGYFNKKTILYSSGIILMLSLIMALIVKIVFVFFITNLSGQHIFSQILSVGLSIFTGLACYFGIAYLLKVQELFWLIKIKK